MLTTNTRMAIASESQRARLALPLPSSDTTAAPMIGNQMTVLSRLECKSILFFSFSFVALIHAREDQKQASCLHFSTQDHQPQPAEQGNETQDHGERIGIQVSRLHPAHRCREAADAGGGTVDQHV